MGNGVDEVARDGWVSDSVKWKLTFVLHAEHLPVFSTG